MGFDIVYLQCKSNYLTQHLKSYDYEKCDNRHCGGVSGYVMP